MCIRDSYTTNHGEQTLTDSLTDALDAQNIDAQPLDLLTSTIPEDCDLLIINAPTTDFSAGDSLVDEISQLQDYLAAGGKLLLTSSVYAQTPQLDAVLAQFGLARAGGMVVEGDSSKALYNSADVYKRQVLGRRYVGESNRSRTMWARVGFVGHSILSLIHI